MAEDAETVVHPVLGALAWQPAYSHWLARHRLPGGAELDVMVDPGGDRHAFLGPAARLFRWALKNERRMLRRALREELLALYNDTWRQGDEPRLSADELTARLEWQLLVVSASEEVAVEFGYAAGELFGGHSVAVEVDAERRFSDVDLRG